MTTKLKIIIPLVALALLLALGGGNQNLGEVSISSSSTNSSSTIGSGVAVKILSANPSAQMRGCTNLGTSTLYLSYNNSTSTGFVSLTGDVLLGSTRLEMTNEGGNLYQGDVYALTSTGTTTVSCFQL